MKHIILLLIAILFAFSLGFAQEEVAVEQRIEQQINILQIYRGWDVHLLHNEADSGYRVAIITNEDYAPFAFNVQLCNVKGDTLTILENTQLPRGTVVEVEGPMTFQQIAVGIEATAKADKVIAVQSDCQLTNLFISRDADFHIQHYLITDLECGSGIEVWDRAKLTLDTISGTGNAAVKIYDKVDFQIVENNLNGRISLDEYEKTPDWHYQQKDSRVIKTKEVNNEWISINRPKWWDDAFQVEASLGYRLGTNPSDANSPFLQSGTLSVNVRLATYFRLNRRWALNTGFLLNTERKYLCHQVSYEDNALEVIDGQEEFQRNRLKSYYMGVPVTLYYYLGKRQTESISLDFFCGRLIGEELRTSKDPTKLIGFRNWSGEKVNDIFNPWKLEVGLSFNTNHLGILHGFRVFTNLLPEYKPGVTTEKIRTVGVEFKF